MDFDIANLRGRSSFTASLQKRKALGLVDSDSEDELPQKKKLIHKKSSSSTNTTSNTAATQNENIPKSEKSSTDLSIDNDPFTRELQETLTTTEEFLAAADALLAEPLPRVPQPKATRSAAGASNGSSSSSSHNRNNSSSSSSHNRNNSSSFESQPSSSFIELSDNEEEIDEYTPYIPEAEIEDLDPSLAEFLRESATTVHQPQKISIKLQYVHNLTEISEKAKPLVQKLLKPIKILVMDTEQFFKVVDVFCIHKKLNREEIVLTYNDQYVYKKATPASIGMSEIGVNQMNVYPRQSYEKMLQEKEEQKLERLKKYTQNSIAEEDFNFASSTANDTSNNNAQAEDNNNTGETFMLRLGGRNYKDIQFRVKPTTTLKAILKSYKERTDTTNDIKLSFEGETLDLNLTVQETDLEDEDQIEIV